MEIIDHVGCVLTFLLSAVSAKAQPRVYCLNSKGIFSSCVAKVKRSYNLSMDRFRVGNSVCFKISFQIKRLLSVKSMVDIVAIKGNLKPDK